MNHRSERQRGIGAAAGDHDIGAGRQRLGERKRAEVRIGAQDALANLRERRARIEIAQLFAASEQLVDTVGEVVAHHHRDLQRRARRRRTSRAQASGFTPPAFAITRTPRSRSRGARRAISGGKSRA